MQNPNPSEFFSKIPIDKAKYAKEAIEHLNKIDDEILREITLKKIE